MIHTAYYFFFAYLYICIMPDMYLIALVFWIQMTTQTQYYLALELLSNAQNMTKSWSSLCPDQVK